MRHNYIANYESNHQSFIEPLSGSNKKKLLSEVYNAAKNARYGYNEAKFWVIDIKDGSFVYDGRIDNKGRAYYLVKNNSNGLI